ncbi:MAG: GHKL domain-containing protein [Coriobacteriales bacterium]|nr:GHKL domain-containing protein [Coriobacteriales bacterium]
MRNVILRIASVAVGLLIATLIAFLVGQVLSAKYNIIYYYSDIQPIYELSADINGGEEFTVFLPQQVNALQKGDVLTLRTNLEGRLLNNLLIKTVHTSCSIYVDDQLYVSVGEVGTFPDFQKVPPDSVSVVTLPEKGSFELKMVYKVSDVEDKIELPKLYQGDRTLLFSLLLEQSIMPLILSLLMLTAALAFIIVGLTSVRHVTFAETFVWLGMACLCCAIWTLCSNDIVLYLIPEPALLYTLTHIGIFSLVIPFVRLAMSMLQPVRRTPMLIMTIVASSIFVAAIISHLSGFASFFETYHYVIFMEGAIGVLLLINVLIEFFLYRNPVTRLFIISVIAMAFFAVLEVVNVAVHTIVISGFLLQLGVLFMVCGLAAIAWQQTIVAFDNAEKSIKLQFELLSMNRNLEMQRTLYETLASTTEEIRKLRHDMRHQLSAIKGMIDEGECEEARGYIDDLYGNIPSIASRLLCDNFAVNALVVHYLTIAEDKGIQCDLKLVVPRQVGRINDTDLCVIIGNLMENAIEACANVEAHKRFIKLNANTSAKRFTLVMDNSFDGHLKVRGGEFYSRKRGMKTRGIGMESVRAEVVKYNGSMKYETENEIFKTSLYLRT